MKAATFCTVMFLTTPLFAGSIGKIAGTAVDATSGERIQTVDITIDKAPGVETACVDGEFVIVGIPEGVYDIRVGASGYRSLVVRGVVVNRDLTTNLLTLQLKPDDGKREHPEIMDWEQPIICSGWRPLSIDTSVISLPVATFSEVLRLQGTGQWKAVRLRRSPIGARFDDLEIWRP